MAAAESLAAGERNRLGLGDGPVLELRKLLEADVGFCVLAAESETERELAPVSA